MLFVELGTVTSHVTRHTSHKIIFLFKFQLVEREEMQTRINKNGGLELDYELDLDLEEFESLQLPEISHGRYLHDFKVRDQS